jgi:hypothetical protein
LEKAQTLGVKVLEEAAFEAWLKTLHDAGHEPSESPQLPLLPQSLEDDPSRKTPGA